MLHANFIDPMPGFFLTPRFQPPSRTSAFVRARLKDNIYAPFMRRSRGVASVQKCAVGVPLSRMSQWDELDASRTEN